MRKILFFVVLFAIGLAANAQSWLTDVLYDKHTTGVYFGYVNQRFKFTYGEENYYADGVWGDKKYLHGLSAGAVVQGNWGYGIGLYWALNAEFYLSSNDPTETEYATSVSEAFDTYLEFTFQMPLHIALTVPLADDFAVGFHTGPGITLTYLSLFSDMRGYFEDWSGLGESLNVINLTYDFALYLELEKYRLEAQWSVGLIDNGNDGAVWDRMIRNKFAVGMTVFLD